MSFKISEICEINKNNITKRDELKHIYYLDTANLTEGIISELKYLEVGKDKIPSRAKRKVFKKDIVISTVRPNQKHYGIIRENKENLIVSTGFAVLTPYTNIVDPEYLYRYLTQDKITKYLQGVAETSTSAYPSIKPSVIGELEIELPDIEEQKFIANILSSLDEKIETNNTINQKLEEMTQAIFKQWFVDFEFPNEEGKPYKSSGGAMVESELGIIPEGWTVNKLKDVIDFYNGYAFKSKDLLGEEIDDCYHVFKMGHIKKGGGLNKDATKSYIARTDCLDLDKYVLQTGDLLMCMTDMKSNVALLGHTALMDEDGKYILNQRVGLLRVKNKAKIDYPFLYILTNTSRFIEDLRSRANSGVQVNLSTKEIKESLIVVPDEEIHSKFNKVGLNIFKKVFSTQKENENLQRVRDILLPKLMSGEICLPIEEEVCN
ncbi:TPA: restriction endonuclease subunit S [Bacillus cereus]|nr:restriction endonuclease subunit S [Bacillus cereus]